ncbi:NAD(P)H-quinone oxidoreductase subunit 2 A, chloroplastic, partial [Quillaja saponaria]
ESGPCLSPSVADHPLGPATDHRLGKLLPHQLANQTRAPPRADSSFCFLSLRGISSRFQLLFPSHGQVLYALLTRSRHWKHHFPSDFACVKHARQRSS